MRILYVCHLDPATTDVPLFLAQAWERSGHPTRLHPWDLELEHEATAPFWTEFVAPRGCRHARFVKSIQRACDEFGPEVLLISNQFLLPDDLRRVQARHRCLCGFLLGYNHLMEGCTVSILQACDFVIVHDSYLLPVIKGCRLGHCPNVFFMPFMAEPREHRPVEVRRRDRERFGCDIAFIGGISPNRIEAVRRLGRHHVRVWGGREWARVHDLGAEVSDEPVYGLKKTLIYNAASIVLNIEDSEKQVNALSNRVTETLACGGFVLTEWRHDLQLSPLRDGESIACYRSLDEMAERADHYLAHPEERTAISKRGRAAVLGSLTYDHVAADLIGKIEGIARR